MSMPYTTDVTFTDLGAGEVHEPFKAPELAGKVRRFRVIQEAGDLEGFEYALYEAAAAFADDGTRATNHERYRVSDDYAVPSAASVAGADATLGLDLIYKCRDTYKDEVGNRAAAYKQLHLWLKVAGIGTGKTFRLVLCTETFSHGVG
jgi:hypothetical protein